jgi:dTDP-4-amino-4,6-dideoxy-D-galactose acyltransferase
VAPGATDFEAVATEADALGLDCVYLLVPADDKERLIAAQRVGFVVVDVRVELEARTVSVAEREHGCRSADQDADSDWLKAVAAQRFTNSRFFADPGFGHDAAARLFEAWITRGLSGGSRHVIVLDDQAGFVICDNDASVPEGVIELIGTSSTAARGTGGRLMSGAHEWFLAQGLSSASVVTQAANISAMRLYERIGYRMRRSDIWLHRWRTA